MYSVFLNNNQAPARSMSITLPCENSQPHHEQHLSPTSMMNMNRRHSTAITCSNSLSLRDIVVSSSTQQNHNIANIFSNELQRNEEKLNFGLSIRPMPMNDIFLQQDMPANSPDTKSSSKHICIKPKLSYTVVSGSMDFRKGSMLSSSDDDFTYKTPETQREIRSVLLSSPPRAPHRASGRGCCVFVDARLPESILIPLL